MKARVEVLRGGDGVSGRVIDVVDDAPITIGRSPDVTLSCPSDGALSRRHAEIGTSGPELRARDLGSKHGMFVNGTRVTDAKLAHGDQVQVGDLVLRVLLDSADQPAKTGTMLGWAGSNARQSRPSMRAIQLAPTLPDGYERVRMLGEGAMGSVHLARHLATGEHHAIKLILPRAVMSAQMRAMFLREAAVQSRLVHPNIVRVHRVDETAEGAFSIVMEHVSGGSVATLLHGRGVLAPAEAIGLTIQILDGLQHAHDLGIVHRDIKEDNILLDSTGVAKLADFGLAKNFEESGASGITREGAVAGTLPYMAREQLLDYKHVRPPADVYSAGATLYRLLTGQFPRDYLEGGNWIRISLEQPVIPVDRRNPYVMITPALAAVVHRALATDVAHRFPTARAFRSALAAM